MDKLDVHAILERLSKALNVTTDAELANKLGVAAQTISTWKKRNKVPFDHIIDISSKYAFSLDSIVFGEDWQSNISNMSMQTRIAHSIKSMSDLYLAEAVLTELDEELHLIDQGLNEKTLGTIISAMKDVKKRVPGGIYIPSAHDVELSEGISDYLSSYYEIMHLAQRHIDNKQS